MSEGVACAWPWGSHVARRSRVPPTLCARSVGQVCAAFHMDVCVCVCEHG